MYAKVFSSLFDGSFYGAGAVRYSVWIYLLAKCNQDGIASCNAKAASAAIGCTEQEVSEALDWLASPDPASRNPEHQGRRIDPISPYEFLLLNYSYYRDLKSREMERDAARIRQQRHRSSVAKEPPSHLSQMSRHTETETEVPKATKRKTPTTTNLPPSADEMAVVAAYNECFGTNIGTTAPGNVKAARRALSEGYSIEAIRSVFVAVRDGSTVTAKWCRENNCEFEYLVRPTYRSRETKEMIHGPLDKIPNELQTGRA